MKKLLTILIFITMYISSLSWRVIEQEDEFGDKNGSVNIVKINEVGSGISVGKYERTNSFIISLIPSEYIGSKTGNNETSISLKVDENPTLSFIGRVHDNFVFLYPRDSVILIEEMKKGKILKVVFEKYNGERILRTFNIEKLEEAMLKLR